LKPTVSSCDDFIRIGLPDEGFGVVSVVFSNEAIDRGLEIDERMEDAILEPPPGQFCEEALDGIKP